MISKTMMKGFFITLFIMNAFAQQDNTNSKAITTVKSVDLQKYLGLWYEIAKIPNRFQKQCIKNTNAFYKLNTDGELIVLNSCTDEENKKDQAEGVAKIVDKTSNAKLEVSFVSIFGFHLFWGDYWIIGLDENYEFAVVGTPNRKYGWILNRQPQMSPENLQRAYSILKDKGYNPKDFVLTKQSF